MTIKTRLLAATLAVGVAIGGATSSVEAAHFHGGGGFHGGGFHGGGFHGGGFHGGGFHGGAFHVGGFHHGFAGFHGFGGFHGFRMGGGRAFHGGFAHAFHGGGFHSVMAGRHWGGHRFAGRFGNAWAGHGLGRPYGFASGLGSHWRDGRNGGRFGLWGGYGGYSGYGDGAYYTDYDGLWGGDVFGLEGLAAAGLALSGDSCAIYSPIYDNAGRYIGVEPVNIC
jgi:hypothetical protein